MNDPESVRSFYKKLIALRKDPEYKETVVYGELEPVWDDSANAGFSDASATPWIMVNPNYTKINAKDQISREDSVFKYYQKLIKLRHESDLIVYGTYDLILDEDKDIYAYIRTLGDEKLIVYCNFSENTREVELPEEFTDGKILISNYNDAKVSEKITLRPYEAIVIQK